MDVYVLNSLLQNEEIIDDYESLIWTERFSDTGDFELVIRSTPENRRKLKEGAWLSIPQSFRIMQIQTIDDTDSEADTLKVSGPSIEEILKDRIAVDPKRLSPDGESTNWELSAPPADIIRDIFNQICVIGNFDGRDIIPFISSGSVFPTGTILEHPDSISVSIPITTLFQVVTDICAVYGLGFCLVKPQNQQTLKFIVYAGNNRTTSQKLLPVVAFSAALDNLADIKSYSTSADYKNCALVTSKVGSLMVYSEDSDAYNTSGFNRKILPVTADDITEDTENIQGALKQRGLEALAQHRKTSAFDGKTPQGGFVGGEDYLVGDVVEMINGDGVSEFMRVVEHIIVCDVEGERSYPTLVRDPYIMPGTWYGWDVDEVWDDAEGVWDEQ